MNPEIKQKWLEALRGGHYRQGSHCLKRADGVMCPLGVLCDVAGLEGWRWSEETERGMTGWVVYPFRLEGEGGDSCCHWPPIEVLLKAEIDPETNRTIIKMNDIQRKSFAEIADWIEENL